MKLGFGLYKHMLNGENYQFASQIGATHIVAHLTDYFNKSPRGHQEDQPVGDQLGWGFATESEVWSVEYLNSLKTDMADYGLKLEALENFSPAFWHDILLNGPLARQQMMGLQQLIRNMGEVGIPIMGYNFSLAGVAGRTQGPYARGGAISVGMEGHNDLLDQPIPKGMVWNMVYDDHPGAGVLSKIEYSELRKRYLSFLEQLLPVAEESGVALAIHPDDPPLQTLRNQPRLGHLPRHYREIMQLSDSSFHVMELCLGTFREMVSEDFYESIEYFAENQKIGYIHFRNVRDRVPHYKETFVDDGDIDMAKVISILEKSGFEGMLIPDHTPQLTCQAPWHAGMAYAMGYMRALLPTYKSNS